MTPRSVVWFARRTMPEVEDRVGVLTTGEGPKGV